MWIHLIVLAKVEHIIAVSLIFSIVSNLDRYKPIPIYFSSQFLGMITFWNISPYFRRADSSKRRRRKRDEEENHVLKSIESLPPIIQLLKQGSL